MVKGRVINAANGAPLAFVHIVVDGNALAGGTSDIDGYFRLNSKHPIRGIICSYVGFVQSNISLDTVSDMHNILIKLMPLAHQLREVEVKAGKNPAHRIIQKVVENKDLNNPENILSFKYQSYNKFIYDFEAGENHEGDSIKISMDKRLENGHFGIMESVTERKYIRPDKSEEVILASRISGLKKPSVAPLATDIQPFSFYLDHIKIFEVNYINPIAKGTFRRYLFHLEDTIKNTSDTTYIISFQPKAKTNITGLKGLLYVNTNKYAVQNVIAEPAEKALIHAKIQQEYRFLEDKYWFPEQLDFEITMGYLGLSMEGKSYIKNVELLPEISKKDFSVDAVHMDKAATTRDSSFWSTYRHMPLTKAEQITYEVIDSMGEAADLDRKIAFMEKMGKSRIQFKFIDLDFSQIMVYNKYEKLRLSFGAFTNEQVSEVVQISGFGGYGFGDQSWKYGGSIRLNISPKKELSVLLKYQNTLREIGISHVEVFNPGALSLRNYIASKMDRIEHYQFEIGARALKYAQLKVTLNQTAVSPKYAYEYRLSEGEAQRDYTYTDITVNLRYAFREKLIYTAGQRIGLGTRYPIVHATYTRAVAGLFDGDWGFQKFQLRIGKLFEWKVLGKTMVMLEGGYIDTDVPYGLLFTGEGSLDKGNPIYMKQTLQTAKPYEFLSDQYTRLTVSHNFGSLLLKAKNFKPHFILHHNMGWGALRNPDKHQNVDFQTMDKGFYESGIQMDNIFRQNYLGLFYLGIGMGVYYRYGPYTNSNMEDNLICKFSFTISTG